MTKRLLLGVAVCALFACAPDRTYETVHGLEVFDTVGLYDVVDVELATAMLIEHGGRGRKALPGLRVRFQEEEATISGCSRAGAYHPELSLAVVQTVSYCLAATAFIHELAHHLEWKLDGEIDYGHQEAAWQPGGAIREAEEDAKSAACGAD